MEGHLAERTASHPSLGVDLRHLARQLRQPAQAAVIPPTCTNALSESADSGQFVGETNDLPLRLGARIGVIPGCRGNKEM